MRRARGFTLIELLVVLALVALATAGLSLALRDPAHDRLEREAERLASLLDAARAEARTQGLPVRWRPLPPGNDAASPQFRFEGLPAKSDLPARWMHDDGPRVEIDRRADSLVLGPEPLIPAQGLTLRFENAQLRLVTDGMGPFAIERQPPPP